MSDDYNQAAFDLIVGLRGGLPDTLPPAVSHG